MTIRCRDAGIAAVVLGTLTSVAQAGMPRVFLTDIVRMRLEMISFFVVGLLVCTLFLQLLWNFLRRDFTALPRLSYPIACGAVTLWGLLFVIVLTMVAGTRELMTPEVWQRAGALYKITSGPPTTEEGKRRARLRELAAALWRYAESHDGRFPPHSHVPEIDKDAWQVEPRDYTPRYVYVTGLKADEASVPVVYEPGSYGRLRLVLFADGHIDMLPIAEIRRAISEIAPPGEGA